MMIFLVWQTTKQSIESVPWVWEISSPGGWNQYHVHLSENRNRLWLTERENSSFSLPHFTFQIIVMNVKWNCSENEFKLKLIDQSIDYVNSDNTGIIFFCSNFIT